MLCKHAEEMMQQVKALQSDMKKVEAEMRAVAARLWQTEQKARRLHRKVQSVSA